MSNQENLLEEESFRDHISTVDEEGNRVWVYAKKPKGKWTNRRDLVSYILLAIFFSTPFLKINGNPVIMLNVPERKFSLLGQLFFPQDFYLFVVAMLTMLICIVLFTVIYGRIFCGWICPQTIFMEGVYRKIEYLIEGDWQKQMTLKKQPLNAEKVFKKTLKHIVFLTISFIISNYFLMYIITFEEWYKIVSDSPSQHLSGLAFITVFSIVFYWVYSRFREQVCTTVCPYGRLQGVMLDRNSIIVAYDHVRGENRAKLIKNEDREEVGKGDCIDCKHCVHVCPTGIDIRNGVQLECINCTACIDACDDIMLKINKPTGLIRYDSEEGITNKQGFKWTKRIIAYTAVLIVLMTALGFLMFSRAQVEITVTRTPGLLYQERGTTEITNLYSYKIVNKTNEEIQAQLKISNMNAKIEYIGNHSPVLKPGGVSQGTFFVILPASDIKHMKTKIDIGVYRNEQMLDEITTNFIGPAN
jgi:cytochrome c oxidase accessory protein FixG